MRARLSYGFHLLLPIADRNLMQMVLRGDLFETAVADALCNLIRPGDVFVDGGAHVGLYTLIGAKQVGPTGRTIAFEPHPLNAELLRLNTTQNHLASRVVVEEAALSDQIGVVNFCWSPTLTTNGRLLSPPASDSRLTPVKTVDLDHYLSKEGGTVDIIKLDLEGGEVQALTGMKSSLTRARCVIMEVNDPRIREQGLEPSSVVTRAMDLGGFSSARVLPLGGSEPMPIAFLSEELVNFGWTNVLLAR